MKHISFFEIIIAVVGIIIATCLVIFSDFFSTSHAFGIAVGIFFTLFPFAIGWIKHIIDEAKKSIINTVIENMKVDYYNSLIISKNFLATIENATKILDKHPSVAGEANKKLSKLATGTFIIKNATNVYIHDTECIKRLSSKEVFKATCPFKLNPDAISKNNDNAHFCNYIQAQIEAADRGVKIHRLYIYEGDALCTEHLEHLNKMCVKGIEIKTLSSKKVVGQKIDDFVIFGENLVGVAKSENESIDYSEYYICDNIYNNELNRIKLKEYDDCFNQLYKTAEIYEKKRIKKGKQNAK